MTMTRSVTVALRPGIGHAVLPDNRSMVTGVNYNISYEDYSRMGAGAFESVLDLVAFNTTLKSREGIDLTTNTASLPTVTIGGITVSRKLGRITEGFAGELFRLVKLVDLVDVVAGDVVVWSRKALDEVTADKVGGTGSPGGVGFDAVMEFAGVAIAAGTHARYIWVQVDGAVDAVNVATGILAGDPLILSPTVDKRLIKGVGDEVQTLAVTAGAQNDTFKLTFNGHESSAAVTIPSGGFASQTAAAIQTALNTISDFSVAGNRPVVAGADGGPFTITFSKGIYVGEPSGSVFTLTSKTGAAAGGPSTVTTAASPTAGALVGVALTDEASNAADMVVRWPRQRPRHDRRNKNLFART